MTNYVDDTFHALVKALRSGQQADMDGTFVKVSRQACEEAADLLEASHAASAAKDAEIARLTAALAESEAKIKQAVEAETRACIAVVRKLIDDYISECGCYDPTTGVTEFPGNGEEWVSDMEDIAETLTARLDQPEGESGE